VGQTRASERSFGEPAKGTKLLTCLHFKCRRYIHAQFIDYDSKLHYNISKMSAFALLVC
jgi:hypothetical protein